MGTAGIGERRSFLSVAASVPAFLFSGHEDAGDGRYGQVS
jgi:hypothetical protein